jgi:hypothetical protein
MTALLLLTAFIVLVAGGVTSAWLIARNPERDARLAAAERQRAQLARLVAALYERASAGRDADPELDWAAGQIEELTGTAAPDRTLRELQKGTR